MRQKPIIRIEKAHKGGSGRIEARISGRGHSPIALFDYDNPAITPRPLSQARTRPIRRAIVYANNLDVFQRLSQKRAQAIIQARLDVIDGYDDAQPAHAAPPTALMRLGDFFISLNMRARTARIGPPASKQRASTSSFPEGPDDRRPTNESGSFMSKSASAFAHGSKSDQSIAPASRSLRNSCDMRRMNPVRSSELSLS